MSRRTLFILLSLVAALALSGCAVEPVSVAKLPVNADGYRDVSPAELAVLLKRGDVTLVNVHVPYDGELPDTDLLIPYTDVGARVAELPADKDAPIVLYCRSGSMSTTAAKQLAGLGYTRIYELDGGMVAWREAGFALK